MIVSIIVTIVALWLLLYILLVDRKKLSIINRFGKTKLYYNRHTNKYRIKYLAYRYMGIFPKYKYYAPDILGSKPYDFDCKQHAYQSIQSAYKRTLEDYGNKVQKHKFVLVEEE